MEKLPFQKISIFKGKNGLWGVQVKLQNVVPFIYSNKEYVYKEIEHHAKNLKFEYITEEI